MHPIHQAHKSQFFEEHLMWWQRRSGTRINRVLSGLCVQEVRALQGLCSALLKVLPDEEDLADGGTGNTIPPAA